MRTLCLGILALTLSCGGATKNPATTAQAGASPQDEKLGEYIARHGGLPSLGGPGSEPNAAADSPHLWLVQRPVKLDGVLDEWPARAKAKETLHGDPGARVGLSAAIQYDATNLYVGGEVTDDRFTRTARFGADEDYASLVLAFPIAGGRFATYEVGLFAGKPGESAGSVRALSGGRKGAELAGARIVEAPTANGYTFEASLPWSAFPEARTTRVGLRGAVRYHDADGSLVATGGGDVSSPTGLPSLPSECEQAMIDQILAPRGLISATPRLDTIADVVGDTMKERILAFDRVLLVCGPGYLGGGRFFFRDLGGELVRLDVRDVTGRGKQDLLVRRRATLGSTAREYLDILSFFGDQEEPRTTFAHEISVASGGRRLSNAVRVSARQIEVSVEPASNWDQASYREPLTSDAEPILFPWGAVTSRSYRFDGTRFVRGREVTNPIGSAPPPRPPARPSRRAPSAPPRRATCRTSCSSRLSVTAGSPRTKSRGSTSR